MGPVPSDGPVAHFQNLADIVDFESGEEPELDDAGLPRRQFRKLGQCSLEVKDIDALRAERRRNFTVRHMQCARTALQARLATGVIHENLAHCGGRDREEVFPISPVHLRIPDELQKGFVDKRCRLESVLLRLTPKELSRRGPEMLIHKRKEFIDCSGVTTLNTVEEQRDIFLTLRPRGVGCRIRNL